MSNWKELAIKDCIVLESLRLRVLDADESDELLIKKRAEIDELLKELGKLEQPFNDKIDEIDESIDRLHKKFVAGWDISDKTYECNAGTATLRTTKALKITNKEALINLLQNIGKLPQSIGSWNLSYLRKLKDVDMIDDLTAHYEEHQNVVIKEASE